MNNTAYLEFDFESLPVAEISLTPEDIQQALTISQRIPSASKQWETYLNALGLFAVKTWLAQRVSSLSLTQDHCTILQADLVQYINNVVSNLEVGNFKLCLIFIGSLTDEEVTLPQAVVEVAEFVAHFYLVVEVFEEEEFAVVSGFLSYKQLLERLSQSGGNYQLPLSLFEQDIDKLLLYLECLQPEAIPLPVIAENRNLSDILKLITAPALNVGRWLWNELDQVGQDMSWVLLPSVTPAPMRCQGSPLGASPQEEYTVIINQIQRQGLEIPLQARSAYQDILLAGVVLRLYAVTWITSSSEQEWTLLLILGVPSCDSMQHNIKMRVSDRNGILVDKELPSTSTDSYLFTRVVGSWDEKFILTVGLMDGVETTLPPFAFDLTR